mmetsp:Transcript_36022/g.95636  ORF Transcript_36022/g.95636 Transcript_36022/m.95636 type:complete len:467 (-) Transcript_36022:50-1450(-)
MYTAQQLLRLNSDLHRSFVRKNRGHIGTLRKPILQHLHLLRPGDVSAFLHHFAKLKVADPEIWNRLSQVFPTLMLDAEVRELALCASAYSHVSFNHYGAFDAITALVGARSKEACLDTRSCAMLALSFSKLRIKNVEFMKIVSSNLVRQISDMNDIDLTSIATSWARLQLSDPDLFHHMRPAISDKIESFSVRSLCILVHAYGRLRLQDEALLRRVVVELQVRCRRGERIDAVYVSLVIEGFGKLELEFTPPGLASFVEINLPKVIGEMDPKNVVRSVPALPRIHGVPATDTFCVPVFARVLEMMPQQQSHVVASFVEAAVRLRFAHRDFWLPALQICDESMALEHWSSGSLASLVCTCAELSALVVAQSGDNSQEGHAEVDTACQGMLKKATAAVRSDVSLSFRGLADLATACRLSESARSLLLTRVSKSARDRILETRPMPEEVRHVERIVKELSGFGIDISRG